MFGSQRAWVFSQPVEDTRFLIVDDGPGLSGSSFLSVAEALAALGVPPGNVILLCAHLPDLSGGRWREHFCQDGRAFWPASWTRMERRKFLLEGAARAA